MNSLIRIGGAGPREEYGACYVLPPKGSCCLRGCCTMDPLRTVPLLSCATVCTSNVFTFIIMHLQPFSSPKLSTRSLPYVSLLPPYSRRPTRVNHLPQPPGRRHD